MTKGERAGLPERSGQKAECYLSAGGWPRVVEITVDLAGKQETWRAQRKPARFSLGRPLLAGFRPIPGRQIGRITAPSTDRQMPVLAVVDIILRSGIRQTRATTGMD